MKFKQLIVILISFILMSFGLPKNIQKKVDKEIKEEYNVEQFEFVPKVIDVQISSTLPSPFHADNFFEIKFKGKLLGYAYVSKAPSKTDQFDYLVLLDTELVVKKAKVLIYREDYGGEIGSKRWLQQFIGKTQNDEVKYQDNIIAISGATISVRSMTSAMNDLLKSLKILHSKHIL
jgi:Na+-translocating ferredoxin:NAD+ oxidoreductase RnfG subunit